MSLAEALTYSTSESVVRYLAQILAWLLSAYISVGPHSYPDFGMGFGGRNSGPGVYLNIYAYIWIYIYIHVCIYNYVFRFKRVYFSSTFEKHFLQDLKVLVDLKIFVDTLELSLMLLRFANF